MTSRKSLMSQLEKKGVKVCGTTEEFNGQKGGIWCSGEEGDGLFEYWTQDYNNFTFGVKNSLNEFVQKKGWWWSWNDGGTIMCWPM